MSKEELLKGYKAAFRDLYNMLVKHASADEVCWSDLVEEYANAVEVVKGTEIEKFVAGIGLNILVELERRAEDGKATV
jgi:hypothetical protein